MMEHPEYIKSHYRKPRKESDFWVHVVVLFIGMIMGVLITFPSRAETKVINNFVTVEEPADQIVDNPYQTIPITDAEFEELRWVVALESGKNYEDKKAVVASIFNRVLSSKHDWGGSVHGVLSKKGQFSTYKYIGSKKAWAVPDEVVDDAISEVLRYGIECTVLPRYSYVYFDSRGGRNGKNHIKIKKGNTYGEE